MVAQRISRQLHSEFCVLDYMNVIFKEAKGYALVLTGKRPQCEHFCRVVPRKGQRLAELDTFLDSMKARYSSLKVKSNDEKSLKRVLTNACKRARLVYSNNFMVPESSVGVFTVSGA